MRDKEAQLIWEVYQEQPEQGWKSQGLFKHRKPEAVDPRDAQELVDWVTHQIESQLASYINFEPKELWDARGRGKFHESIEKFVMANNIDPTESIRKLYMYFHQPKWSYQPMHQLVSDELNSVIQLMNSWSDSSHDQYAGTQSPQRKGPIALTDVQTGKEQRRGEERAQRYQDDREEREKFWRDHRKYKKDNKEWKDRHGLA